MADRTVILEDSRYRKLRCPNCGNRGEASFSADTFVLIRGNGVPFLVGGYADAPDPRIDCHGCDYAGPIDAFTERHRPGNTAPLRRDR